MALIGLALGFAAPAMAAPDVRAGVTCESPPPLHCHGADCASALILEPGNAVEPKSGRKFFLDYPCDLKPGEKVIFILNIHGAGSIGNWQRHYFPAFDYKEKYRLVIATPTAASTASLFPGMPAIRIWQAAEDDAYLQDISTLVFDTFGKANIKAFWLAGHSQGGMTSNRIVCSDYFRTKVDGWLSLSGGRIGPAQVPPGFGPPRPADAPPPPADAPRPGAAKTPTCDFSYIFESGEREIVSLPDASPWADRFGCGPKARREDIVDDQPGWVYDTTRQANANPVWGLTARPGTARVFVYPNCRDGRVVADVVRLDKGHTEGLEPKVTEVLIQMIVAAPGGRAQQGS
ncbi:hypothetical protein QO010_002925 [Caulobacter ginsengisoli]|uniref:Alpha/beta hydrolase n=1 Tax=Caulobacter ginsengisoli TaxID=400775 RepID=A0ABU0IT17_9CAUL|nr:hypothetical protein [Caulobacter ginsengisoli]MDQ0465141.1 hypothetical protein [Caulobacter ginsengisoli]